MQRFSDKWVAGFTASIMYWPFVNTVMYSCIQPRYMNLYADCASLFFAAVMSYITYRDVCSNEPQTQTESFLPKMVLTLPLLWQSHF